MLILFSHTTLLVFADNQSFSFTIIRFFGTIGVDLFFVLSGFLIGSLIIKQIEKGEVRFKDFFYFWIRRWFKTLPNYYLILIINLIIVLCLCVIGKSPLEYISYFLFLQNFSEAMPDFFTESWSLTIEEFSYLLGPALLFVMMLLFSGSKRQLFLFTTLAIIIFGCYMRYRFHLLHEPVDMRGWSQSLRKVVIYRIDSIYYGFIGAYLANYYNLVWKRIRIPSLVVGFLLFFSLHIGIFLFELNPLENPLFYNIFYLPGLMLSLLCFFPYCSNMLHSKSKFAQPITYISIISYAIYLVNYSILLLTMDRLIDIDSLGFFGKSLIILFFWIMTLVLSHLLYNYWEKPILKLREHPKLLKYFDKAVRTEN